MLEALHRVTIREEFKLPTDPVEQDKYLEDDLHFGLMLGETIRLRFLQNK